MTTFADNDVLITGLGPVTAVGVGNDAVWSSLREGRTHVTRRTLGVDLAQTRDLPIASLIEPANDPSYQRYMRLLADQQCPGARDLVYTLMAMELALRDAGLTILPDASRAGLIQATEAPGVEQTVGRLFNMFQAPPDPSVPPQLYDLLAQGFYNMQPFVYVHLAAKAFGLKGYCTSVHNACSSGAYAIETAAQCIRSGAADVMIVAGGEAFETAVRLEWFHRLGLYAADGRMTPFALEPSGFFVGEGGAALVLESATHAARRGVRGYAAYLGGAFAHQSWKQTVPDIPGRGLSRVIRKALNRSDISPADVDLVVPHGAATTLSDEYESVCLREALGADCERMVAAVFKPYFGHMLAASGIIDTIGALLSMKHRCVPAAPHNDSSGRLPIRLPSRLEERKIEVLLKISTGFTGHDAALLFRRVS